MTIADKTEQLLKCTLQNNVQFVLNDKIIREGKMIIYHVKDFYISLQKLIQNPCHLMIYIRFILITNSPWKDNQFQMIN